ncbi:MAG: molecular chaperone TorD family protein [Rhodocyclales bacterium]|nr:molecular chaperone TorD family protein [Rhodocyclales bacterium]
MNRELAQALAEDAEALAALHDRELTAETIAALRKVGFPSNLGLLPAGECSQEAWRLMAAALAETDAPEIDLLAADYAAIYLTGAYGASPCESVWTDDDHLVCQEAMFALRGIYAAAGLAAADWRKRPDDHLVLQLLYIAHALRRSAADDLHRLAAVLDEHLLRWLPDFAARVAARAETPFFAVLGRLTFAWCEQLRDLLAESLGEPRPTREEIEARLKPQRHVEAAPLAYMPGAAPSW